LKALAKCEPDHIYFSGRNSKTAADIVKDVKHVSPSAQLTFVEMDLASLKSVKEGVRQSFRHDRLDILMCNAGIMATPPGLSKDGFEIQFATNHLGHAMLIRELLPVMLLTADLPDADVRIVSLTSTGWRGHPRGGIVFDKLRTTQDGLMGQWVRYGCVKQASLGFLLAGATWTLTLFIQAEQTRKHLVRC
jgi:NAD(P)-dependent dehydrogenase (short-subunit alcohol dehydrogenase family)